ncbi:MULTISPECIES: hypothetical protein [unclassified Coleofasciculus]|uniref:hypothetical protein n=1 Tax=unclassified Coleofasciculus TaxID=2692782 RepID=UPI00188272F6|nr:MULTISPECIES: hypothetical protein [unclassified Coleofasciculus]MBE9129296.1 hypothetical protein [Coleofasciculus sp. LEGE 07081]MBE9151952.1 hypothetical protein [Coleofasciculus sp. LEGE 07092]
MFTIDLTLKNTPLPLSVQRKTAEDAQSTYQDVLKAIRSGSPELLELSCEYQPDKKIGVLTNQISAVMVSQKSGAAGAGRVPGFLAVAE